MPVDAFSRNDQAALVSDGSSRWVPPHLVCLVQPRCSGKRSIAPSAVFGAGRGGAAPSYRPARSRPESQTSIQEVCGIWTNIN